MKIYTRFMILLVCLSIGILSPRVLYAADLQSVDLDGMDITEDYETKKTDETTNTLTVLAECPDGFGLNAYVLLADENDKTFRVNLYERNGYSSQIYLTSGEYRIIEMSVYDDYKQEYPFEAELMEFVLTENEQTTAKIRLKEYEKIANLIEEKKNSVAEDISNQPLVKETMTEEMYYESAIEGIQIKGTGIPYYDVTHEGKAKDTSVLISGNVKGDYDIVIKIVQSGVLEQARYQLSLDGGTTYIGEDVIAPTTKVMDAGLTFEFMTDADDTEFLEGDIYTATTKENFSVVSSKISDANVMLLGHPTKDHEMQIDILSPGERGQARFKITSNKGVSIDIVDTIPMDGVYKLPDNLTLMFSESENYQKGMCYTISVKSNENHISVIPIIILVVILIIAAITALTIMLTKKEKENQYLLRPYDAYRVTEEGAQKYGKKRKSKV